MVKCENCSKVLTKSGLYKHRKLMCVPQPTEVPECLICGMQFSRIHARNKHYRNVHSVDVKDMACHPGEKDLVLMKFIRKQNPLSIIEPIPDEPNSEGLMTEIKCPSVSVKNSDSMPMKNVIFAEFSKTYEVDETDVMSLCNSSANESLNFENSIRSLDVEYTESNIVYDSPPPEESSGASSLHYSPIDKEIVTIIDDSQDPTGYYYQESSSWGYNFRNAQSMLSNTDIDVILSAAHIHGIENKLDCWIFSTSFVETIKRTTENSKKIQKKIQKQKILKKFKIENLLKPKRILSVVFYSNTPHWQLIEIDSSQGLIYVFCSLNLGINLEDVKNLFEVVTELTGVDLSKYKILHGISPQQQNVIDCGVYSIVNAIKRMYAISSLSYDSTLIAKTRMVCDRM